MSGFDSMANARRLAEEIDPFPCSFGNDCYSECLTAWNERIERVTLLIHPVIDLSHKAGISFKEEEDRQRIARMTERVGELMRLRARDELKLAEWVQGIVGGESDEDPLTEIQLYVQDLLSKVEEHKKDTERLNAVLRLCSVENMQSPGTHFIINRADIDRRLIEDRRLSGDPTGFK